MQKNKNVLFIIMDQFRPDCIAHLGNSIVKTPHIDALAARGVSFSNAFCQSNPCGPSRMCIFTSTYLCRNRTTANCMPTFNADENLAMDLKAYGYQPKLLGYNDYAYDPAILKEGDIRKTTHHYHNVLPGFDWVFDHEKDSKEYFDSLLKKGYRKELASPNIHKPEVPKDAKGNFPDCAYPAVYPKEDSECWFITDKTLECIKSEHSKIKQRDQPGWFISLNYIKPHPPRVGVKEFLDLYKMDDMPLPPINQGETQHPMVGFFQGKIVSDDWKRAVIRCYYAMITEVDYQIGRIVSLLKESGQLDDTIIILSADHGEYNYNHDYLEKKFCFDETMRIPLIIVDPSQLADESRNKIVDHLAESIDIAPTILDLLQLPVPFRYQGMSHKNLLHNLPGYYPKNSIHFEYDYRGTFPLLENGDTRRDKYIWVIRDKEFKYVQFADPEVPPMLFDLKKDPNEFKNLANDSKYATKVLEYCQKMLRWRMVNEDQRPHLWFDDVKRKKVN